MVQQRLSSVLTTTCCDSTGQVRVLLCCGAAMYGQTEAGRGPQVGAWGLVVFWGFVNH